MVNENRLKQGLFGQTKNESKASLEKKTSEYLDKKAWFLAIDGLNILDDMCFNDGLAQADIRTQRAECWVALAEEVAHQPEHALPRYKAALMDLNDAWNFQEQEQVEHAVSLPVLKRLIDVRHALERMQDNMSMFKYEAAGCQSADAHKKETNQYQALLEDIEQKLSVVHVLG